MAKCTFTFSRHPPSQCRQITKKESGQQVKAPLISLEKVCTLLWGPEWPFPDKTAAAQTGAVDKLDIRIQQLEGMDENTASWGWIHHHCKHVLMPLMSPKGILISTNVSCFGDVCAVSHYWFVISSDAVFSSVSRTRWSCITRLLCTAVGEWRGTVWLCSLSFCYRGGKHSGWFVFL